jgi:hypothetical protein
MKNLKIIALIIFGIVLTISLLGFVFRAELAELFYRSPENTEAVDKKPELEKPDNRYQPMVDSEAEGEDAETIPYAAPPAPPSN